MRKTKIKNSVNHRFGEVLNELIEKSGVSKTRIAEQAGVSPATLTKATNAGLVPSYQVIIKIAEAIPGNPVIKLLNAAGIIVDIDAIPISETLKDWIKNEGDRGKQILAGLLRSAYEIDQVTKNNAEAAQMIIITLELLSGAIRSLCLNLS